MSKRCLYILLIFLLGCNKPSKEARELTKEFDDTKWELYLVTDPSGADITQQVVQDSMICQCMEFYKSDKDPTTNNLLSSKCSGLYYPSYKGYWGVFDWKRVEKEAGDTPISNRWAELGIAIGNIGNESYRQYLYLRSIQLDYKDDIIIHRIYKKGFNSLDSDTLLELRYYKKTSL